jgi:hypothetical protein
MFSRIRDWFFGRVLNRHRLLYRYWDGSRFVSEDPFVLLRKLTNSQDFDPDNDLKLLQIKTDPKMVIRKIEHVAEGVRKIFGVPELKDGGLTELENVNLLIQFLRWMDDVKKNGATNQISAGSTANPPETGELPRNDMKEVSGSTSTEFV